MKYFFFIVLLLAASIVVAESDLGLIEIKQLSTTISPGEVYQAEITLKNPATTFKKQNIRLYNSLGESQPISPFLVNLAKNNYFLYFELPQSLEDGEYTLRIEDQSFLVNNVLVGVEEASNITLSYKKPSVSLTPGAIVLEKNKLGQFTISAKAADEKTEISFNVPSYVTHQYVVQQYLNPQVPHTFTFAYNTTGTTTGDLVVMCGTKAFTIPLIIQGDEETIPTTGEENTTIQKKSSIAFFVEGNKLVKELKQTESLEGNLKMGNLLEKPLLNIKISLEGDVSEIITVTPATIDKVNPLANFSVLMKINAAKQATKPVYTGKIIVANEEYQESLDVQIILNEETTPIKPTDTTETEDDSVETTKPPEDHVVHQVIPWNISGGYEQESKVAARPIVALITILLVVAITIFLLSQKKTTKKKTFKEMMEQTKR